MRGKSNIILPTLVLISLISIPLQAQERRRSLGPYTMYEQIVYQAKQERLMTWLAHDMNHGRATGTRDAARVARYIETHFRQYGLEPFCEGSFYQPLLADSASGTVGRNVIGFVPSAVPSDEYVLITAHYDHLGVLDGNIYNGADDNASGVTVLLNLADMFGTMKKTRTGPDKNIIFAALDAKELNMAGSKALVGRLQEREMTDSIICAINIDQIGTVLEPVHEAASTTPSTAARNSPTCSTGSPTRSSSMKPASRPSSSPPASTATPTRPPTTRTSSPTPS